MIPKLNGYELPKVNELPTNKLNWKIDPSRAALLIHDMQEYFLDFWEEKGEFVNQLVQNIKLLRTLCKSQGIPVFYSAQPINQKPEDRALLNDLWGRGIDNRPERRKIVAELTPEDGDYEIVKLRYSAFHRTQLQDVLKEQGRDQLIICGVYAHIGCLSTANDAFMNDIKPFVVSNALADFSREKHDLALQMVVNCCGRVESIYSVANQIVEHDLHKIVATILEDDDDDEWPDDDENLVDYGLDSVKIMAFAGRWQRVYPEIGFTNLAQQPNIASWRQLLCEKIPCA